MVVDNPNQPHRASLTELLEEARILLPGTQIFLSILLTVPFQARFEKLDHVQRSVFGATVFATILALVCFVMPAAYHRIAWPVHHRDSFKAFANLFLVAGLIPFSITIVLTTWFVMSIVFPTLALWGAIAVGVLVGSIWWVIPLLRAHDWYRRHAGAIETEPAGGTS